MGWNTWNKFACNVSDELVRGMTDAMVKSGMKDAGYQYINIDDCWSLTTRAADGSLQADPARFPDGIASVADYVHGQGLKLGIYGDRGTSTCGGRPGSQGYETQDATTFANWGIDYLKYDNCPDPGPNPGPIIEPSYQMMSDALRATGRDIVFSVCAWSFYEWARDLGHLQRTTTDIVNQWLPPATSSGQGSILGNAKTNAILAAYGGPNTWNDADMLEVGNSDFGLGSVTDVENQSHFSLWAIMAAPLIAGNDLRYMSDATKATLTNKEVIAINQDDFALQGVDVRGDQTLWTKPLAAAGARAVVLLNTGASDATMSFSWNEINLASGSAKVRDLQAQTDLGTFTDSFSTTLPSHGSATLKVVGTEPARPHGTVFLSDLQPIYAANGLGPVERDLANGSSAAGDGPPIKIGGMTYSKGLGMFAPSAAIYRLETACTSFDAIAGIDDSAGTGGSVVFEVWADGERLYPTGGGADAGVDAGASSLPVVTHASGPQSINVDLTGKHFLKLLVTNGGDGSALDRASWGNAEVTCAK